MEAVVIGKVRLDPLNAAGIHYLEVRPPAEYALRNLPLLEEVLNEVATHEACRAN